MVIHRTLSVIRAIMHLGVLGLLLFIWLFSDYDSRMVIRVIRVIRVLV
jgi:hypothetical protein